MHFVVFLLSHQRGYFLFSPRQFFNNQHQIKKYLATLTSNSENSTSAYVQTAFFARTSLLVFKRQLGDEPSYTYAETSVRSRNMTDVKTLDDLLEDQSVKLDLLTMATTFLQNQKDITSNLVDMHLEVTHLKKNLDIMRKDLEKLKQQNVFCHEMLIMLHALKQRIAYMQDNVPPKLVQDYVHSEKCESTRAPMQRQLTGQPSDVIDETYEENKENKVKDCKKVLFTKSELYPSIDLLTREEFSKIPKYIIGRQPLEAINGLLSTINQILKAKYTLLSLGKNGARKKGELELYLNYRKQQTTVTEKEGQTYFFMAEDYERQTKSKLDKTKLNLITALRYCKRLRQIGTAKRIRYVMITDTHNV